MQAQGIDATLDLVEHVEPLELTAMASSVCGHLCVREISEMGQQWSTTYQHMIHTDIIIIIIIIIIVIRTILLNIRTSIIINTQVISFMDHLETLSIPGHPELYGRSWPVRAPWVSGAFSRQDPVNCRADHGTNVATVH